MTDRNINILFCFNNYISGATVTADTEADETEMPVENMKNVNRDLIWRSESEETDGITSVIEIDMIDPIETPVSMLAFWDLSISSEGTIRVQSWSDGFGGSEAGVDFTSDPYAFFSGYGVGGYGAGGYGGGVPKTLVEATNPAIVMLLGDYREERYWRITLTDPASRYLQASHIYLGDHWQPQHNISRGFGRELETRTRLIESVGGQEYGDDRDPRLIMEGVLRNLDVQDADHLWQNFLQFKKNTPFTVCAKFNNSLEQLFTAKPVRFDSCSVTQEHNDNYTVPLVLKEWL